MGLQLDDALARTVPELFRLGELRVRGLVEPVEVGMGGSIPFVAAFAEQYPDAAVLMIGVADPTSHYHGPNENVSLADLRSAIVAQAISFRELAD